MKNKLGIFTALILSLVIAGSAFASPGTVSVNKAAKAKVSKSAANKKKKRHHRSKRKMMKKSSTTTTPDKTSK
jgi:hypothetical protein